jgi:hypothetical protein
LQHHFVFHLLDLAYLLSAQGFVHVVEVVNVNQLVVRVICSADQRIAAAAYQFMYCCYQGSGTTRRAAGFYLDGTLEELPAYTNGSSNRGMTRLRMTALGGAMSSVNTDQARSPFFWFMG